VIDRCTVTTPVADLGIDGRGAPPEVWALPSIGGQVAAPPAGGRAPPPEAEA